MLQDSWVVTDFPERSHCVIFGVFDGHGPNGRRVSSALADGLPRMLTASPDWKASQRLGVSQLLTAPSISVAGCPHLMLARTPV